MRRSRFVMGARASRPQFLASRQKIARGNGNRPIAWYAAQRHEIRRREADRSDRDGRAPREEIVATHQLVDGQAEIYDACVLSNATNKAEVSSPKSSVTSLSHRNHEACLTRLFSGSGVVETIS